MKNVSHPKMPFFIVGGGTQPNHRWMDGTKARNPPAKEHLFHCFRMFLFAVLANSLWFGFLKDRPKSSNPNFSKNNSKELNREQISQDRGFLVF